MSVTQHPAELFEKAQFRLMQSASAQKMKSTLPTSYTNIRPTKPGKAEAPEQEHPQLENFPSGTDVTTEANNWIQVLKKGNEVTHDERVSFSAFHTSLLEKEVIKTHSQLLPLLVDHVTESSPVCHVMSTLTH